MDNHHDGDPLPLPRRISEACRTLSWPLEQQQQQQQSCMMHYQPLEVLRQRRGGAPVFPAWGPVDVYGPGGLMETLLMPLRRRQDRENASSSEHNRDDNTTSINDEYWSRIAAALLLVGHGYLDEAHNLIGPLSFPHDLPYFDGPSRANVSDDQQTAASYVHCLVHRREAFHQSEFGQTGFQNADWWAGAMLGFGGDLPLERVRARIEAAAAQLPESRAWWQQQLDGRTFGAEEWDPRPLNQLCQAVIATEMHPLRAWTEDAALQELQVLLQHALEQLGYQASTMGDVQGDQDNTATRSSLPLPLPLPHTLDQALQWMNHGPRQHQAWVVTTATKPHTILHVNQAWVELCQYTPAQALGRTFGLIQGPESNLHAAGATVSSCLQTQKPQTVHVVNYTGQTGERFVNRFTVGPLLHEKQQSLSLNRRPPAYLVAVLEKVQ